MTSQKERDPLDPVVYAQGMAQLAAVFPGLNIQPDIYYRLLDDLSEDGFLAGVGLVCRELRELYPNSNLVAIIRDSVDKATIQAIQRKPEPPRLKYEPIDEAIAEENRKKFRELMESLKPKVKGVA